MALIGLFTHLTLRWTNSWRLANILLHLFSLIISICHLCSIILKIDNDITIFYMTQHLYLNDEYDDIQSHLWKDGIYMEYLSMCYLIMLLFRNSISICAVYMVNWQNAEGETILFLICNRNMVAKMTIFQLQLQIYNL